MLRHGRRGWEGDWLATGFRIEWAKGKVGSPKNMNFMP